MNNKIAEHNNDLTVLINEIMELDNTEREELLARWKAHKNNN